MIRYQDIHLAFSGKTVFSGFNLEVPENEKLLLSGPSGCGKTTLFRLLLGFERAAAGRIFCDDVEVGPRHIKAIRHRIFYLSQDIDFRNAPVAAVLDEIFSYEPNQNVVPGPGHRRHLMDLLNLKEEILHQHMSKLSGGERQRLGLLVGFMLNRPVWLLDEPTSSLDEKLRRRVVDYVMTAGKTVLVISHDDIWKRSDTVCVLRWS
jgi:putative ABC transport system ATP-binding protein